jgi:hypothetical protein
MIMLVMQIGEMSVRVNKWLMLVSVGMRFTLRVGWTMPVFMMLIMNVLVGVLSAEM